MANVQIPFEDRIEAASTLPAWLYFDASVLDEEYRKVFGRTWQLVGRTDQAAGPGEYFVATVGREPVVVVRTSDDTLKCFSNVCRHRAGPVASGSGSCRTFRCGYHGWTYNHHGRLLNAPEFDGAEDFDPERFALPEFRVETWAGLVFVNLDSHAPSLLETLEDLPERFMHADLIQFKPTVRKDWHLDSNWKVYVDNYLEGYHIPIVHPALNRELDYARYRTETRQFYSIQHSPIRKTAQRLPVDADGGATEAQYFWIYPNLMINVYPDNYSTNLILPRGPGRTVTIFEWFFKNPDDPAVQDAVQRTVQFSDEVQLEDIAICESVQRGLASETYTSGRYSVKRENGVHHFHRLIARHLAG